MSIEITDNSPLEDIFFSLTESLITSTLPNITFVNRQYTMFEMLLFHSCYIIKQCVSVRPKLSDAFARGYALNLYKFASSHNILNNLPCDYNSFIKGRLSIYIKETELLLNAKYDVSTYLPGKLLSFFYDNPLSLNEGFNGDMFAHLDIITILTHNFRAINQTFDYLIEEEII